MTSPPPRIPDHLNSNWTQLGLLLHYPPSHEDLDLERLLLATARWLPHHTRLFPMVITWLVHYGNFVARHRLKRLILTELESESQPALGLLVETAIECGTTSELRIAVEACRPAREPRPLFIVQQITESLNRVAERNASTLSRKWGVWAPDIELKHDAIRPVTWLLDHNPSFRGRIIRKGDLRCSILEILKRDTTHSPSESQLAHCCAATRVATHRALTALVLEGALTITDCPDNRREHVVRLTLAV